MGLCHYGNLKNTVETTIWLLGLDMSWLIRLGLSNQLPSSVCCKSHDHFGCWCPALWITTPLCRGAIDIFYTWQESRFVWKLFVFDRNIWYHKTFNFVHTGHCWRAKNKFISDILLWIHMHEHISIDWPAKPCIHQFCPDTLCCLGDLPRAMADRNR